MFVLFIHFSKHCAIYEKITINMVEADNPKKELKIET